MLLSVDNNLCYCSSLQVLFTVLVTLQISENSEGDGNPLQDGCPFLLSLLCAALSGILYSCLWAPEKSHTASLTVTLLMQGTGVAWMEGTLLNVVVSLQVSLAGTWGWKDPPGSASPFPCYYKSLVIDLWLLLIKPSLSSGLGFLFHLQLWRISLSPEGSKSINSMVSPFFFFFFLS